MSFRVAPEKKRISSIHKLMNNGHRFGIVENGLIIKSWRYLYEAERDYSRKQIISLESLLLEFK